MATEGKPIDIGTDPPLSKTPPSLNGDPTHIEYIKAFPQTLKGVPADKQELYLSFAARDDEWKAFHTKKLLRKVDLRLLPCLIFIYLMNFLDRSNLAQARLGSLEEDLHMKGTDFNLATSILFVGYLTMQLPSNLLLTRVKPAMYLGLVISGWGVVSTAQAAVQSFGGLLATRIFLGVMEAPFFPGAIMLMSSWYTRSELTYRIAWFYSGSSLANMFGGLLGAGVLGNLDGVHGISGWRWLFIIEGSITIAIGIASAFILPNFPADSKWLSSEERSFAQWRLVDDAKEADDNKSASVSSGLMLALRDWKLYLFVLLQHLSLLSQTFQYFFPSIVKTLGFGSIETLLLTVPVWFGTFLVSLLVTFTSGRTNDRSLHIIVLMLIACIGNVIAVATTRTGPRFFAMFLMPMGAVSAFQIILSWIANSFPRPLVKRSASIAICNMIGNCANIYGSYMYPKSAGPQYLPGGSANSAVCLLVALLALALRIILKRENKKLARREDEGTNLDEREGVQHDSRAEGFRYVL
ncbi:allantoate permease [Phlyctema vagabunda]|uniref:Allantoate permease n=1 Tax=Phlyctema vagabunda TaxID=108571 RepID=A0ABR4PD42_9HELO